MTESMLDLGSTELDAKGLEHGLSSVCAVADSSAFVAARARSLALSLSSEISIRYAGAAAQWRKRLKIDDLETEQMEPPCSIVHMYPNKR